MTEQALSLEGFDDTRDSIVTTDEKVVTLGDVVREHHTRILSDSAEDREQDVALE